MRVRRPLTSAEVSWNSITMLHTAIRLTWVIRTVRVVLVTVKVLVMTTVNICTIDDGDDVDDD